MQGESELLSGDRDHASEPRERAVHFILGGSSCHAVGGLSTQAALALRACSTCNRCRARPESEQRDLALLRIYMPMPTFL